MAQQVKTVHEAFLHELSDVYDAEQQFLKAMQEMLNQAQHPQVKQGLQQHIQETQQQIKNLDQVFQSLNAKPEQVTCKGAAGIVSEFKDMAKEIKEKALIDGAIGATSLKGEHYEIATYRLLVSKAQLMGHKQAQQLLQQNLQMEEQFAKQVEQVDKQLGQELAKQPQLIGHEIPAGQMNLGAQSGMSAQQ